MADEFIYGRVERVSREAPVLILRYDTTMVVPWRRRQRRQQRRRPRRARPAGGRRRAATSRAAACSTRCTRASAARRCWRRQRTDTPVKTRILAGGVHSAKQQVVRIDRITNGAPDSAMRRAFEARALAVAARADAVLVSDYGSGLVTPVARRACAAGALARRHAAPCRSSWTHAMRCRTSTA